MSDDSRGAGGGAGASPMVGIQFSDVDASGDPAGFVRYLDRVTERVRDRKRAGYALLGLQPGDAVLDVGCGPGADVLELEAIVGPSGRAVGVDPSATMVEEARKRAGAAGSRAEFEVAPAEALPFPDATFTAVRTERVLMHVPDPAVAVRELVRVTQPGGRVFALEPDHQMSAIDASDGALCDVVFRGLNAAIRSPRIGRQLRGLFLRAGLVDVSVDVTALVITSWPELQAMFAPSDDLAALAVAAGLATRAQTGALVEDLSARHADGHFFASLVAMRCTGVRP